ncbi:DNA-processing protein DprA [Alphaproteobacteria bacterium]|nr:DNA-processing protein DprA [Alphaproteobacteria bacterium]
MDHAEKLATLRLIRTHNIGPMTFSLLIRRFGSACDALAAVPELSKRGGRKITLAATSLAEAEIEANTSAGAQLIFKGDDAYPPRLAQFDDTPPVISVCGNTHLLHRPMIAMVGARNASINAQRHGEKLAEELTGEGYVIVSGLARGIDTAAHNGALQGGTVAVIAGGIDVVYPPENEDLQNAIAQTGLLLAEMPPGTTPTPRHFPIRNRIIAGMAVGTVVIEAAERSGSLITAREASERGGEVMAIPGSPLDPRAAGCNHLIREGATLVQNHLDIIEALSNAVEVRAPAHREPDAYFVASSEQDITIARNAILSGLAAEPIEIDELTRWCKVSPASVHAAILELELAGFLLRLHGNRVSKILI